MNPPAPSDSPICQERNSASTVRRSAPFSSRSYARSMRTTTLERDSTPSRSTSAVAQPSADSVGEDAPQEARLAVAARCDQPGRMPAGGERKETRGSFVAVDHLLGEQLAADAEGVRLDPGHQPSLHHVRACVYIK